MKKKWVEASIGLAAAIMCAASLSFARSWSFHKSSQKSTDITIASPMKLANGERLAAGSYKVDIQRDSNSPEAKFYDKNDRLVASAPVKMEKVSQKNPTTEVYSDKKGSEQVMTGIRPGGWSENLLFPGPGSETKSAE